MLAKVIFHLTTLACSFVWLFAIADEKNDEPWVRNQAFEVAKKYAESIACVDSIDKEKLITLIPWERGNLDDRSYAKYALIWNGDIGCNGGSGSYGWHISIVEIGSGDQFFVNPAKSSPMIRFQLPIKPDIHIVNVSKSTITVNTEEEISIDEKGCCNFIKVQIQLKEDKKGNWYILNKKKIPN